MAVQLNAGQNLGIKTDLSRIAGEGVEAEKLNSAAASGKILNGDALTVSSGALTDLEKLVLKIKNETESVRQSVSQRRLSILQTVLDSMAEQISDVEKKAILKLEELNGSLASAEKNLAGLEKEKSAATVRSAELDAKIQSLEKAIENEIKNGEDHRKQMDELKRQKAAEDAKIKDLENKIASLATKISGLKVEIKNCESSLDASTLSKVADAIRESAGEETPVPEKAVRQSQIDKEEKKFLENNPLEIISRALDKIDEDILKSLEEIQVVKA